MSDRWPLRIVVLMALVVSLCVLGAWAPAAHALSRRFVLNDGDAYTRFVRVRAGDSGWSPFFRPGVVVWDGGSIIAGHGADQGFEFPGQTLAMVPRVVQSYVSSSPSAKIADMLAEAPLEVDARYDAEADLNVCVVLAGGGDFHVGATAASVYKALRTYCLQRRAAGFSVVVVSVLPSSRPETFAAARMAYNAMLRSGWDDFADGFADVAADRRIGDDGDQLDRQFYLSDELHLTNAGNAVMAAVTAPVLCDLPWRSADCEMRVRDVPGSWSEWRPYVAQSNVWLDDTQGEHLVQAEYRSGGETVSTSDTIFLDTVRPTPRVRRNAAVRRGGRAALRYQVDDAEPCGPTSTVTIQLRTTSGRVLRSWVQRLVPVNEPAAVSFACRLPRGSYRWTVRARDTAGNADAGAAVGRLTVR